MELTWRGAGGTKKEEGDSVARRNEIRGLENNNRFSERVVV